MNRRISAHCPALEMVNLSPAAELRHPAARRKVLVGIGLALAGALLAASFCADAPVEHLVRQNTDEASLRVAHAIGHWGDFGGVAAFAAAIWWTAARFRWVRIRYCIQVMLLAAVCSGVSANMVRVICGRTRPNSGLVEGWHGPVAAADFSNSPYRFHAFPSAHTAVVAGFLSPILVVAARKRRRGVFLWGLAAGAVCGIALMAAARVWAGVHHASDVVAATLLGGAWGVFLVRSRPLGRLREGIRAWRVGLQNRLSVR